MLSSTASSMAVLMLSLVPAAPSVAARTPARLHHLGRDMASCRGSSSALTACWVFNLTSPYVNSSEHPYDSSPVLVLPEMISTTDSNYFVAPMGGHGNTSAVAVPVVVPVATIHNDATCATPKPPPPPAFVPATWLALSWLPPRVLPAAPASPLNLTTERGHYECNSWNALRRPAVKSAAGSLPLLLMAESGPMRCVPVMPHPPPPPPSPIPAAYVCPPLEPAPPPSPPYAPPQLDLEVMILWIPLFVLVGVLMALRARNRRARREREVYVRSSAPHRRLAVRSALARALLPTSSRLARASRRAAEFRRQLLESVHAADASAAAAYYSPYAFRGAAVTAARVVFAPASYAMLLLAHGAPPSIRSISPCWCQLPWR